jgi:branched-subunit amino acid ABC-type transport system permease component
MKEYLPFFVVGITAGSVYGLAAVGLVLTYKTSGIFNFAHGAQAALAAYLMFEFHERMGMAWPLAMLLSLLLAGVAAGLALERVAYGLASVGTAARVAATVGLLVAIQGALVVAFGSASLAMPIYLPTGIVELPGVNVRVDQIIVTVFVLAAVAALYLFFKRTRLGLSMQAVVDDPALLGLQAISPIRVRRLAWLIGSSFAALSGMLLAPTLGLDAFLLTLLVFYAYGAAAVGAFSSLPITYLGGLAIGVAAALLTKFLNTTGPIAALPATLPFLVLFGALLVVPKQHLIERGSQAVRRPLAPRTFSRRTRLVGTGAGLAVALAVPSVVGTKLGLYTTALAYVILFASLSLLVRMSGQVSLCHIAFAAVGATTAARAIDAGIPFPVAVLLAGLVAIPVGAILAVPAIRLSGVYLAVATFGFGLLVQRLFYPSFLMFGHNLFLSAPRPKLAGINVHTDTGYYYVVLAVTTACVALVALIRAGRMGRLLRAFADSPTGLNAHGTNTTELKVLVFCTSAFLAGIGGALIGPVTGTATQVSFDLGISLLLLAVLFVAGRQPLLSAVLGAVFYIVIPGYIDNADVRAYTPVVFGALALVAAIYGGLPWLDRLRVAKRLSQRSPQRTRLRARLGMAASAAPVAGPGEPAARRLQGVPS